MNKIKNVLEGIYHNKELRKTIVPLFLGSPGLGKTHIIYEFAKSVNANIVEFITSQIQPYEVSGLAMPDKKSKKMMYYDFDKLDSLKDGDILFFDELLNGNPVILNACLTLLESRRTISGKALPDIMIIAAANPQGMCPLTPQIKERFVWYDVKFNKQMWIYDYMIPKYDITATIGNKLAQLIEEEDFTSTNFNTPRSISKGVNCIINEVPTPYENRLNVILNELIIPETQIDVDGKQIMKSGEGKTWLSIIKEYKNELTKE